MESSTDFEKYLRYNLRLVVLIVAMLKKNRVLTSYKNWSKFIAYLIFVFPKTVFSPLFIEKRFDLSIVPAL